ncbi:MAG: hypothetical protein A3A33_00220 [Candidatus Yanofskybacteria bacterium RIFCSPLOWO2_01_FULL_49_25]|uniref:Uncharacterized protein n=1 Tax=Candidatus Yanofskybacteria bacterium RIFCSPLOWO2_01_FULL_49_25 TaxID=1802701 RepID=A0A1F8GWN3_9BACT|nr:MAG: hypothetical protein A3A33_00220 [Candidatus Yanofskybacteria bacterium RIFCSPLOWO2_01_FULL_49_25]
MINGGEIHFHDRVFSRGRDLHLAKDNGSSKTGICAKIEEYRRILNDQVSSGEFIEKRLQYLEAFCRNVIKLELGKYAQKEKN